MRLIVISLLLIIVITGCGFSSGDSQQNNKIDSEIIDNGQSNNQIPKDSISSEQEELLSELERALDELERLLNELDLTEDDYYEDE